MIRGWVCPTCHVTHPADKPYLAREYGVYEADGRLIFAASLSQCREKVAYIAERYGKAEGAALRIRRIKPGA